MPPNLNVLTTSKGARIEMDFENLTDMNMFDHLSENQLQTQLRTAIDLCRPDIDTGPGTTVHFVFDNEKSGYAMNIIEYSRWKDGMVPPGPSDDIIQKYENDMVALRISAASHQTGNCRLCLRKKCLGRNDRFDTKAFADLVGKEQSRIN